MFNTNTINLGETSQIVQFNAPCTGIMQRSHSKSSFIRFQKNSPMEKRIFPYDGTAPYIPNSKNEHINIVILQMMVFGDEEFLVEFVREKDI
jgi:hypothetical protein